jgi:hypothetical protein
MSAETVFCAPTRCRSHPTYDDDVCGMIQLDGNDIQNDRKLASQDTLNLPEGSCMTTGTMYPSDTSLDVMP